MPIYNVARKFMAWLATLGVIAVTVVAAPAHAAPVDLVVNVTSDRGVYSATDVARYTVRVDNRGPASASGNSMLTLTVPNTDQTSVAWEQSVICSPTGGAQCPTAFTRSGSTIGASLPPLPLNGTLTFTVHAPGNATNFIRGSVAITALVTSGSGDTDAQLTTNTSSINILIADPVMDYSTNGTGPETASASATVTYDVVLRNTGELNSIYAQSTLTAGAGTGTAAVPAINFFAFTGVTCLNETGGASCANLRAINAGSVAFVQPKPLTATGTTSSLGVLNMPKGSTVTLRYTVSTGRPVCTDGTVAMRTLTLTGTARSIVSAGISEAPALNPDNLAAVVTNLAALPCAEGDLATVSISQPTPQSISGVAVAGPFEYTVLYSNLSGATASDADIEFSVVWGGGLGATINGAPTCSPSGAASCPTSWVTDGAKVTGLGAVLPVGTSLSITYTGVGGADNTTVCRPVSMLVNTRILPPLSFRDTNYLANNTYITNQQSQGNNARGAITQTDVGSPCSDSHDDSVSQSGPFIDPAATIPLAGPAVPGQVLYFRSAFTNQTPSPAYASYGIVQQATAPSGAVFDSNDPDRWWRHQDSDPAGLPYRDDDTSFRALTIPFDTGVRCASTGGATCPLELGSTQSNGGGGARWIEAWSSYWKVGTQPAMPAGGTLSFISSYKIPAIAPRFSEGGCVPTGVTFGSGASAGTATSANLTVNSTVNASTDPGSVDRTTLNDTASVTIPIQITRCTNTLAITKTALTATMPTNRSVEYQIVVTNTSGASLDFPRLIDTFSADAPASIECVSTTGGAACPTFTPSEDVRRFSDGSTGPITFRQSTESDVAQFDFVWGEAGQPTMPTGSSVTFVVTIQYPSTYSGTSFNTAYFLGDKTASNGPWPMVRGAAEVTTPAGSALTLSKRVNPVTPTAGSVVTFTVDMINTGDPLASARFEDVLNEQLIPTNPGGFGNLECRSLTLADNVLLPGLPVGATACPTFTSDINGIRGTITDFQTNSGIRLTYTAIAPLTGTSVPNIAQLVQNDATVTAGDTWSQANFLTVVQKATDRLLAITGPISLTSIVGAGVLLLALGFGVMAANSVRLATRKNSYHHRADTDRDAQ